MCVFFFSPAKIKIKKPQEELRGPRSGVDGCVCVPHSSPSFLPKKDALKMFFEKERNTRVCPVVFMIVENNQTPTLDRAHAALSYISVSRQAGTKKGKQDQHAV